jgi:hypothetical protein
LQKDNQMMKKSINSSKKREQAQKIKQEEPHNTLPTPTKPL